MENNPIGILTLDLKLIQSYRFRILVNKLLHPCRCRLVHVEVSLTLLQNRQNFELSAFDMLYHKVFPLACLQTQVGIVAST
jgi:hypothetical protein